MFQAGLLKMHHKKCQTKPEKFVKDLEKKYQIFKNFRVTIRKALWYKPMNLKLAKHILDIFEIMLMLKA